MDLLPARLVLPRRYAFRYLKITMMDTVITHTNLVGRKTHQGSSKHKQIIVTQSFKQINIAFYLFGGNRPVKCDHSWVHINVVLVKLIYDDINILCSDTLMIAF